MMDPVHHPGEPFVRPRRPNPLFVAAFLIIAILVILGIGLVVVLLWSNLTEELTTSGLHDRGLTHSWTVCTLSP